MDYFEVLDIPLKMLKLVGYYHTKNSSWLYKTYGYLMHFLTVGMIIISQLILLLRAENIFEISDIIAVCFYWLTLSFTSLNIMWNFEYILQELSNAQKLISFMRQDGFGKKIQLRKSVIKKFFMVLWISCLIGSHLGPMFSLTTKPPFRAPYNIWTPFNYEENFTNFLIVLLIEYLMPMIYSGPFVALDLIPFSFFDLSAALFEELADRIKQIDTDCIFDTKETNVALLENIQRQHDSKLNTELQKCIEIHLRIREFIANSQNIFSTMICVKFMISSIVLCTGAYSISMVITCNMFLLYSHPFSIFFYKNC